MSTAGQIVGGVVGGIFGAFAGAPMLGASIGMSIGGYIDPPKGPKGNPPSASDLAVQTATYGAPLGDGDGTYGTLGNVFWVEGNSLRAEEHQAEGGKGGAPTGPSTYDIYGTFAVGFGEGEIDGYGRIWFSSKLVCDYTSSDMGAILATSENGGNITLYTGSMSQLPDDRIQADMGAANTPAYRGLHYIVVKDWPMADFGNSLMGLQVKAEIINDGTISQYARRLYIPSGLFDPYGTEYGPFNPRIESGLFKFNKNSSEYTVDYTGRVVSVIASSSDFGTPFFVGKFPSGSVVWYDQTVSIGGGSLYVGESIFKQRIGNTTDALCGAFVGDNGLLYLLMATAGVGRLEIYDEHLTLLSTQAQSVYYDDNVISLPALPGVDHTFCVENNGAYLWYSIIYGGDNWMLLYSIPASGALTQLWQYYPTAFYGTYGDQASVAAADGVCYHVSNGGSLAIFDRARIVSSALVPLADIIERRSIKSGLLESSDIDVSEITQTVRGYKVSSIGPIRSSLEPLQAAWPFDVIPNGYKLKFVPRGGASVATIDIGELGCVAGNDQPGVQITTIREMDTQLPREVQVTYLDVGREYDQNTGPGAKRWNTDAVNVENLELAIVMNATEAAQTEEVLLYMRWLERHDVSFVLPPTHANLEPADVITITSPTATYELRLVGINYLPDGRIECAAKFNNAAIYTSTAAAQEGLSTGQVLTYPGAAVAALLDVPCVDSDIMNKPGILAAVCGYSSSWPGGTLFRSDDSGQTWSGVQGFTTPGVIMGLATNSIGPGSTHMVDKSSRLSVRFFNDGPDSISESAMFSGGNHFAYGAHGRWEIIAAQTCTDETDGTTTLGGGLMRGRFGTEQYMTTHAVGDAVVLLNPAAVRFVGLNTAAINIEKQWRAVTNGRSLDTSADYLLTYSGANLKPLAPIHVKGSKSAAGDWAIGWTRRTRTGTEPFSGVNAPLGETSEAYEVEIYSDATYTTLKRTIYGLTSASAAYTSAQQVTDFGAVQKYLYIKVYQLSSVVGRGYPAASEVGPLHLINLKSMMHFDEAGDLSAYRVLGIHCDGTNGSTTFTDVVGKGVTVSGNAQISTARYPALTGKTSSGLFDGAGDYLQLSDSSDWDFGTGDSTIRFFCYPTGTSADQEILAQRKSADPDNFWYIRRTSAEKIRVVGKTGGVLITDVSSTGTLSVNAWNFVEIVRTGGSVNVSIGGAFATTVTTNAAGAWPDVAHVVYVGIGDDTLGAGNFFYGNLSEIEVYKGVALHTANFTPPTNPFIDTGWVPNDTGGNVATVIGTATTVSDSDSFGGRCLQANQASGYVSIPPVDLTSLYWTIECFIKPDALPSSGNYSGIFEYGTNADGVGGLCASIRNDGLIMCHFAYGVPIYAGNVSVAQRVHMFIQRAGTHIYIGSNGAVGTNIAVSSTTFFGNNGFRIGYVNQTWFDPKAIKIDEWRVTSNEAKYPTSGTYAPPTIPFPDP